MNMKTYAVADAISSKMSKARKLELLDHIDRLSESMIAKLREVKARPEVAALERDEELPPEIVAELESMQDQYRQMIAILDILHGEPVN
jgi:hypothetical protein